MNSAISSLESPNIFSAAGNIDNVKPGACIRSKLNEDCSKAEIKLTLEDVENKALEVGETLTLNLKVENTNKKATFISSNEEVLTVNENGVVEAKSVGKANVYAEIQDNNYNIIIQND